MVNKTCSFIGHREIENCPYLESKIIATVENLIENHNVTDFLFGSNSQFDNMCHKIVTKLQETYPYIKRVVYTCKSEECVYENERDELEKTFSSLLKRQIKLKSFEDEVEHKNKYVAGKASYVERNFAMIDDSDYCVFYYDENYNPEINKFSFSHKSGTKLAYLYATKRQKTIINLYCK